MSRLIALAVMALALAGCSSLNSMLALEPKTQIPGDRKPVMLAETRVTPDERAADLPVTLPKPYVNAAWSQPGGFADNALHHLAASGALATLWVADAGTGSSSDSRLTASPVAANGTIYVLDAAATVAAFDAATGAERFRIDLTPEDEDGEAGFGGGIALEEGRLFVATGFGFVVALDPGTGAELWRREFGVPFRAAPVVDGGRLFVINQENQLFVLRAADGGTEWDHRGGAQTAGILASNSVGVAGDLVVVPYSSGELFGLRVQNGRQLWADELTRTGAATALAGLTDIAGRPVVDRGIVIAVGHSGRLVGIDTRTGERIWTRDVAGIQTPWVAGDFVFVVSLEAELICLSRADGRVRWVTNLPRWEDPDDKDGPIAWSGPVLASDRLLLAASTGEMISVSPYDGQVLGRIDIPDGVYIAPIVAGETVFVLTDGAELIALR